MVRKGTCFGSPCLVASVTAENGPSMSLKISGASALTNVEIPSHTVVSHFAAVWPEFYTIQYEII